MDGIRTNNRIIDSKIPYGELLVANANTIFACHH